jgi:hypothetical protein
MENKENTTSSDTNAQVPELTLESVSYLLKAAKWGKFLAILGFIVAGLMAIAGILMSFVLNSLTDEMAPLNLPFSPVVLSFIYLIAAGIYLIPVIFLNSFSNNATKAVNMSDTGKLTSSLKNLKNLFVFVGVATVVILTLYTFILIIAGTAALVSF